MTLSYTQFFRFGIPDFTSAPWHSEFASLVQQIDKALFGVLFAGGGTIWANSTAYTVGDIVISPEDGTIWLASVAHTSSASPVTFSAERLAHPTFWLIATPNAASFLLNIPAGDISSVNVQDALNELDNEKAPMRMLYSMVAASMFNNKKPKRLDASIDAAKMMALLYKLDRTAKLVKTLVTFSVANTDDQIALKAQVFG